MEKLDYSDINKFLASLGVVIIGLALVLPYFYLKEDFGLIIGATELANYSDLTKSIILTKESYINFINNYILYLCVFIFFIGLVSFGFGIKGWNDRQKRLDIKLEIDIEKGNREVLSMKTLSQEENEEDKKNEIQEETKEIVVATKSNNTSLNYSDRVNNYIRIEKEISKLFLLYNQNDYIISLQQRIDNRMNVDILLQAKKPDISDVIVEVKYTQTLNGFSIRRIADAMNTYIAYYKNKTGKSTIPLVIIVTKNNNTPEEVTRFKNALIQYKIGLPDIEEMFVEIIEEKDIGNLNIDSILGEIKNRSKLQILHKHFLRLSE